MKRINFITLTGTVFVVLGQLAWAGPHDGGSGFGRGGFAGVGRPGGGGHFTGGARAAPAFSGGGARFSGRSIGGLTRAPQQFSYYSGARTSGPTPYASVPQVPNRSTSSNAGRGAAVNRQPNRVASTVGPKPGADPRLSTAAKRQSFIKDHAFARHDANWHRDWDTHRFHRHNGLVFVFTDGFWWGLNPAYFPSDYYPYYADENYPYDNYDQPYDYYDSSPYNYDDQGTNAGSNGYGNDSTIGAVQSALAKLGYYRGAIDGVEGDETQAALARYQQDRELSVTGTVTAATLQSLGLTQKAS